MRSSRPSRNSTGKRLVQIDDVGVAVEPKHFLQPRQVLDRIVEELVAILERHALRDHVQEIELAHADRQAELDDLIDVGHVLLVDADVDVDDDAVLADRAHHALHQLVKGAGGAGQPVVQLGCVAVQAVRDLAEPSLDGGVVEFPLREHHAVGDGLDAVVADLLGVADEVDELRVDRAFAARQDDLVGVQLVAAALDLAADVVVGEVHAARRVGVQTEHAAAVARRHQPHPVFADVGDALAREHSAL